MTSLCYLPWSNTSKLALKMHIRRIIMEATKVKNHRPTGWRPPDNRSFWVNFHSFRHTWASWMRRYGGLDTKGLVATRNWRDELRTN